MPVEHGPAAETRRDFSVTPTERLELPPEGGNRARDIYLEAIAKPNVLGAPVIYRSKRSAVWPLGAASCHGERS
jgi:hypothetical protein